MPTVNVTSSVNPIQTYAVDVVQNFCPCLAFRYQRKPNHLRDCKHLKQVRGFPLPISSLTESAWLTYPIKKKIQNLHPKFHLISEIIPRLKQTILEQFYWSIKYDGIRLALSKDGGHTRNGVKVHFHTSVFDISEGDIYDVELISVEKEKVSHHDRVWNILNGPRTEASKMLLDIRIFDVLQIAGVPTTTLSFKDRYAYLCRTVPSALVVAQTPVETWKKLCQELSEVLDKNGEGLVVRSENGMYLQDKRRNTNAFKMKSDYLHRLRNQLSP
jgi:ATP-dependent DNA ligase